MKSKENIYNSMRLKWQSFLTFFKKHKKLNIAIVAALLLITAAGSAGYAFGYSRTSDETKFLESFETLLHTNPSEAMKSFILEDNFNKVSTESMTPFYNYLMQNENRSRVFIESLQKEPSENSFAILKKQKKTFGTSFAIELKPVYIHITTTYKDTEIYLEDEHILTSDEDNFTAEIGPLVPGIYTIKGIYKNQYGENSTEQTVSVVSGTASAALSLEGITVSIESNYEDAYVYLNGEKTDLMVKDFQNIGPFLGNDGIILFVEKKFPWGVLRSSEVEVNISSRVRLNIDPMTDELQAQLDNSFKAFYQSLFSALSSEKIDQITNAENRIKESMYNKMVKDSFIVKNSYSMSDIEYEQNVISLTPSGNTFTASANVTVEYKTGKRFLGIPIPNSFSDVIQKYKTTLTYDYNLDQWLVSEVKEL
jgi:uncharacterized membrane protein YvbJ